jgi:hypothetical protein
MSRSGALTGMLYILYTILVWYHLQAVSTAIGSITTTHAPIGEPCPSRTNIQKISQQQMVIYRKAAAHSLYTAVSYRYDKQLLFFTYVYLQCNGDLLSKNKIWLIQLDNINTYASISTRTPITEFNKTMHM